MYDLNSMRYFVKVVVCRSFTEAARTLGVPKSTVSDKISELESVLGVTLLTRTTRKLVLTDVGADFFKKAESALTELELAGQTASSSQVAPSGLLRITAPAELVIIGAVGSAVAEYKSKFPGVKVELNFGDRRVDLIGEGYDIAIRMGNLEDSSLMAKKVGSSAHILVASEAYLKKSKRPEHPKDLRNYACLLHEKAADGLWTFQSNQGKTATVQVQSEIQSNSFPALKAIALKGLGIALLPRSICLQEINDKKLTHVLPGWSTAQGSAHIVYPAQRFSAPKIREIIPILEKNIREALGLEIGRG